MAERIAKAKRLLKKTAPAAKIKDCYVDRDYVELVCATKTYRVYGDTLIEWKI